MLIVSPGTLDAFEAGQGGRMPLRFCRWLAAHVPDERKLDEFTCKRLVDAHASELELTGLTDEDHQFLFLLARHLMPEMGDEQYLRTMDAVLMAQPVSGRITAIAIIARTVSPDA